MYHETMFFKVREVIPKYSAMHATYFHLRDLVEIYSITLPI